MLNRSNILVIVGTGKDKLPNNKLLFWDDNQLRVIGEIDVGSKVLGATISSQTLMISSAN